MDTISTCPLKLAIRLYEEDKILEAGRVLRHVLDKQAPDGVLYREKLDDIHHLILKLADRKFSLTCFSRFVFDRLNESLSHHVPI
jgi:hypothetical protein